MPKIHAERPTKPCHHPHRANPKRKRPSSPVDPPEQPVQPPVSVPFHWEEVPGKPKPCYSEDVPPPIPIPIPKLLDPPPRLWNCGGGAMFSNTPSPNTVLDGPDVGSGTRSVRTFSFRKMRWETLRENENQNENEKELSGSFRGEFVAETRKKLLWETICEGFKQVVPWRRS